VNAVDSEHPPLPQRRAHGELTDGSQPVYGDHVTGADLGKAGAEPAASGSAWSEVGQGVRNPILGDPRSITNVR
jgi:hypothetical protein